MFFLGTIFGILITVLGFILSGKINLYNLKSEYKSVFTEVHQSIGTKSMRFLNRVNQIVTFKVRTRSFGSFDMVIYLDKNQISLFRNQRLIYKSEVENNIVLVKSELINSIIGDIDVEYPQMHDLVAVSGAMIDKKTFDDMLKNAKMELKSQSIDDLMGTPSKKQDDDLDLDSILDKINKVGLNGLTEKELKYLKDQSK